MGEAIRSRAFWTISFGHACAVAVISTMLVHLAVHLREDTGVPLSQVGILLAVVTVSALVGHALGGWLGDRLPIRFVAAGAMVGHAVGMALLAFGSSLVVVTAFAVTHGLAWGIRSPLMGAIRAAYFGRRNFATIMGTSSLIVMIGSLSGPILSGFAADVMGSFRPSFAALAVASLVGAGLFAGTGRIGGGPERAAVRGAGSEGGGPRG
jgi:MFS family permease